MPWGHAVGVAVPSPVRAGPLSRKVARTFGDTLRPQRAGKLPVPTSTPTAAAIPSDSRRCSIVCRRRSTAGSSTAQQDDAPC